MEFEKSHNLQFERYRTRTAGDIIPYKSECLRTMGTNDIIPSLRSKEPGASVVKAMRN